MKSLNSCIKELNVLNIQQSAIEKQLQNSKTNADYLELKKESAKVVFKMLAIAAHMRMLLGVELDISTQLNYHSIDDLRGLK